MPRPAGPVNCISISASGLLEVQMPVGVDGDVATQRAEVHIQVHRELRAFGVARRRGRLGDRVEHRGRGRLDPQPDASTAAASTASRAGRDFGARESGMGE